MKEDYVLSQFAGSAGATAEGEPPLMPGPNETRASLLAHILKSLEEDKAEEIVQIDLKGKSEIADHMVVCSGRSSRQVAAIAEHLTDALKQDFGLYCKVEGKEQGDWVLIDAGDVIIHVFRPEVREFYQLEKMWLDPAASTTSR